MTFEEEVLIHRNWSYIYIALPESKTDKILLGLFNDISSIITLKDGREVLEIGKREASKKHNLEILFRQAKYYYRSEWAARNRINKRNIIQIGLDLEGGPVVTGDKFWFEDGIAWCELRLGNLEAIKMQVSKITPDYIDGMRDSDFISLFHSGFLDNGERLLETCTNKMKLTLHLLNQEEGYC